jgi:uncharacterized protein YneF (UPF0154 family)
MHSIKQLFFVLFVLTIVATIDFFFLIGRYGTVRLRKKRLAENARIIHAISAVAFL